MPNVLALKFRIMAHFTAFFPAHDHAAAASTYDQIERAHREGLREESLHRHDLDGAWLVTVEREPLTPRVVVLDDGWVAVAGQIIDLDDDPRRFSAQRLLSALVLNNAEKINRFEGAFAAVAWHTPTRTAFVLNDQTSTLNLYVGDRSEGLWASTVALPLARALGVGLDPGGVREFFSRGTVLTPTSMFDGIRRLEAGESLRYRDARTERRFHWRPVQDPRPQENTRSAAAAVSELAKDRIRRFAGVSAGVIADLTGGYDSRMVATAANAVGKLAAVTVDGPDDHGDVRIAKLIARAMDWDLRHFDTSTFWSTPIGPEMRRELTYRANG